MSDWVSREDYDRLLEWYKEQIQRKDEEIEDLRKQNAALLQSMMKQAELKVPPTENDKLFGKNYESNL
ncbi:MAG: hypothetical protein ACLFP2_04675 [Candidatus Woesearchaeota archaeon]